LMSFHCKTMGGFILTGKYKFLISFTKLSAIQCFPFLFKINEILYDVC
jgi:hypothetical protein